MMKFSYIFWDNDGVLVDTERYYCQASREALAQVGIVLDDRRFAAISLGQGRSIFELAEQQGHPAERLEELRDWRNRRYSELLSCQDTVIPGVRQALEQLSGRLGMAIVTSSRKDHFDIIHSGSGLMPYFDFVLTREDYRQSKPSPEPYLLALQKSGCHSEQCLVIEDSPRGLAAAKAAGLTCWMVPGFQSDPRTLTAADRIFSGILEIAAALS
jgi:HAD superfamily hydrolase (TIGR01509 family)